MSYAVEFSSAARADLMRLHEHLLERAKTTEDIDASFRAIDAIVEVVATQLVANPFICRKVDGTGRRRELIIPFGRTGYVALFEVVAQQEHAAAKVVVLAVRHQREDDYH